MSKYHLIYSDPPWKFGSRGVRSGMYDKLDYPQLSVIEIGKLNVKSISEKNAALFLWVPSAFLMDAGEIMNLWGFKYIRVEAVWEKIKKSGKKHKVCGPWGMNEAEYLLMGIRGVMCKKQVNKKNLETIVTTEYTGKHSEKPAIFRDRIEYRFGNISRVEMFARTKIIGWSCIGNEIDGKDIREVLK